jgi:parvulin-like peptidyl-prolyl isomerase
VKSLYGFHLFKVLQKEKGRWIEFAEVKDKIRTDLAKGREEQEFRKWLDALKSGAKIRIDEERLKQVKIEETRNEEPRPEQAPATPGKG